MRDHYCLVRSKGGQPLHAVPIHTVDMGSADPHVVPAPEQLFIFAGAGASGGQPASLPTFDPIRDALLDQIGLPGLAHGGLGAGQAWQRIATGLNPEPFLLAVNRAHLNVQGWLDQILSAGDPNAVHHVLAQALQAGARVWTANFDRHIESASARPVLVAAWPGPPAPGRLCKPHGSLGGPLVFTAEQALQPLRDDWRKQLTADVSGASHVVFIGYSARDFDLQPLWTELTRDKHILWFDRELADADELRRGAIVRDRASLTFLPHSTDLDHASFGIDPSVEDPGVAFVQWATAQGWASVAPELTEQLTQTLEEPLTFPALTGEHESAKAAVLTIVGAANQARRAYLRLGRTGPGRREALTQAIAITANHDGMKILPLLSVAAHLPRAGTRLTRIQQKAARTRVSTLANAGRHERVLTATAHLRNGDVSTLTILRASALRFVGNLNDAALTAESGLEKARAELHNMRVANAATQLTYALLWAGDLTRARDVLDHELRPTAALAAARWVAWANVLDAALLIHHDEPSEALSFLWLADAGFRAEGLLDGAYTATTMMLTVARQADDRDLFQTAQGELARIDSTPGHHYTRGHSFSREAIQLEQAHAQLDWDHDPDAARELLRQVTASRYPVHQSLAQLALARSTTGAERDAHLRRSRELAERIGAQGVLAHAQLLTTAPETRLYFP